jgi:hypothetical protein
MPVVLLAQTTGSLTGTVEDSQEGMIPGVQVVALERSTNTATRVLTNDSGVYFIPNLNAGLYLVTVEMSGFKKAVIENVKVSVGGTTTQKVILEIGSISSSVVVEAAQGQVERQATSISSTIEGRQITELPFTSRDALDLALTQTGTSTPGRPRNSTVGGLRRGALGISIDGIRVQDNFNRSGDGFFAYIRPSIDAIEEFSMTQAGQSADSSGDSAVQIKFVTKRGTNEFHGGAWWYHRNPVLNANYYFNNLTGTPRQRQLLNQVGFKLGGPVIRDKLFFFLTLDSFRLPSALTTVSTALTPNSARGVFTYDRVDGGTHSVDVLGLARANGFESTPDPLNKALLDQVAASISGLGREPATNRYTERVRFNNPSDEKRYFPTLRLDYNFNENWRWEGIWNYQYFTETHARPPNFPGFDLFGSNTSHRFSLSTALRTNIGATKINEFRVGTTGGNIGSLPELIPSAYPAISIGGTPGNYYPDVPIITPPLVACCGNRINYPEWQFFDNFIWTRGNHTISIGGEFSKFNLWLEDYGGVDRAGLPNTIFGVVPADPASALFNTTNFPGADSSILSTASSLYAMLTGRVAEVRSDVFANERTREFVVGGPEVARMRQFGWGAYIQDAWRIIPSMTVNAGVRWQLETPHRDLLNRYSGVGGLTGLLGPSVSLFTPGVLTGRLSEYNLRTGKAYPQDNNNFAPNFGVAWNPVFNGGVARKIFGTNPVFRGSYAISYILEGLRSGQNVQLRNEGSFGNADLFNDRDFPPGTVLTRNGLPEIPLFPSRPFDFPIVANIDAFGSFRAGEFADNLSNAYVQSWSLGMQRELTRDTVLEVRYVGNKGTKLWTHFDLDRDDNIFENGLLDEFLRAQNNLAISRAMGRGNNFRNQGLTGQVNLPIFTGAFGSATSTLFGNGTFLAMVDEGRVGDFARDFATNATRFSNLLTAGFPSNLIRPNPYIITLRYQDNQGWSTYNALQVELRRRMSAGLLFQGNYTWGHSLSNQSNTTVDSAVFALPRTLRDVNLGSGPNDFNIYHSFKGNWIYELPFGQSKRWAPQSSILKKLADGWSIAGITRIQSGSPFSFANGGRGTWNGDDGGVDYKIQRQEIQKQMGVTQLADGRVQYLPSSFIGSNGSNPEFLASHSTPGTFGDFFFFEGPAFFRADLTVAKKTYVNENLNIELRAEFLNAFNNINFLFARSAATTVFPFHNVVGTGFGRITEAFRDTSTTNDLGGRMVQFVLRINF